MLLRAATRGVAAQAQRSSAVTFAHHVQQSLNPAISALASRLLLTRVRVCAFSKSSIRRDDETEPDTVDTIASIGKPKRVRKPKVEGAEEGAAREKKKPGRPKKTEGSTKKPAKKKKPVAAKKPKKPKKKVLSAEEKQKLKIKELKEVALLNEPKSMARNAYAVYIHEQTKGETITDGFQNYTREHAERYRNLSSEEKEHYAQIARDNSAKYSTEHKEWVESHTVEQIRDANIARKALHRLAKVTGSDGKPLRITSLPVRLIKDERIPRRALSPFFLFQVYRNASGDFEGVPVPERATRMTAEWKALSAEEVQKYNDEFESNRAEYQKQKSEMFKHAYSARRKTSKEESSG